MKDRKRDHEKLNTYESESSHCATRAISVSGNTDRSLLTNLYMLTDEVAR